MERGVWVPDPSGALGDRPPGKPSTGISGGAGVQGYCLEQPTESEACRHSVGLCRAGLGTHQETGRRMDRPGPGTGPWGWGKRVRPSPSAHTHLQEALGTLTSHEKVCLFQTLCELGKQARNCPHHAEREWWEAFISDRQSGVRPWSPEHVPASPLTVPTAPRGQAGPPVCVSVSWCVKEGRAGFPGGTEMGKNLPASAGDVREAGLIPGLGRFLWRRKWQPTPALLPGESRGQRGLVGYSPRGHRVGHD